MDEQDHYFTAAPASADERRRMPVRLAGRTVEVEVAPGIFSPGGLDKGTAVLLDEAPAPPATGTFLDLGCGWGPLALTLGLLSPRATVLALDVNERAVDLTRRNAATLGLEGVHASTADGIPDAVRFDLIWSNPPIRVGKAALHTLLATWLPRLAPDGVAHLVVQRNLGSDSLQRWVEAELRMPCTRLASSKGFRVLEVRPAAG
jgi:16S rRNA (guanine1207-N2)-methyltransferase